MSDLWLFVFEVLFFVLLLFWFVFAFSLRVLVFGDDEVNRVLDYLYPALASETPQLKTLMQG